MLRKKNHSCEAMLLGLTCSQNFDWLAHRGLDVHSLEIVPSFLQQRCQEVECHHDVSTEVLVGHVDSANGAGHAGDLLELELD